MVSVLGDVDGALVQVITSYFQALIPFTAYPDKMNDQAVSTQEFG